MGTEPLLPPAASIGVISDTDACRARFAIAATYVDRNGSQVRGASATSVGRNLSFSTNSAGSTAVTVDYSMNFNDCASDCFHTLQTKTK